MKSPSASLNAASKFTLHLVNSISDAPGLRGRIGPHLLRSLLENGWARLRARYRRRLRHHPMRRCAGAPMAGGGHWVTAPTESHPDNLEVLRTPQEEPLNPSPRGARVAQRMPEPTSRSISGESSARRSAYSPDVLRRTSASLRHTVLRQLD